MLDRLNQKAKHFYTQLVHKNRTSVFDHLCCLSMKADEISVAYISRKNEQAELLLCDTFSSQENNLEDILFQYVKKNNLEGVPCSWMLRQEEYQSIVIEALPVPPAEFQSAVRWAIKDLVHISPAQAVIDSFPLVVPRLANAKQMMMVVVAPSLYLQKICASIHASGLDLRFIDIAEMGLKNIAALYQKKEKGTAFIYLQGNSAYLFVAWQKNICFIRHLHDDALSLEPVVLDQMALEIQRSLDYYESQWRQGSPGQIIFATTSAESVAELANRLTLPIQQLNMTDKLITTHDFTLAMQDKCLLAIGGALREEGGNDATTS